MQAQRYVYRGVHSLYNYIETRNNTHTVTLHTTCFTVYSALYEYFSLPQILNVLRSGRGKKKTGAHYFGPILTNIAICQHVLVTVNNTKFHKHLFKRFSSVTQP